MISIKRHCLTKTTKINVSDLRVLSDTADFSQIFVHNLASKRLVSATFSLVDL